MAAQCAAYGERLTLTQLDVSDVPAVAAFFAALESQWDTLDILVSNAGFFFFGEAVDAPPERAHAMLQLHVVTPSLLCTRFGRDMRARGRGHILIVSSIAAWRDFQIASPIGPFQGLIAATTPTGSFSV